MSNEISNGKSNEINNNKSNEINRNIDEEKWLDEIFKEESKVSDIKEETKYILDKLGHKAKKALGQNFLIDDDVLSNIILTSGVGKGDYVVEIGPGIGSLTKYLLETGANVLAIELDSTLYKFLEDRFKLYNNFELVNIDVLKFNFKEYINKIKEVEKEHGKKEDEFNIKIVANLPYYITTPIVTMLLEQRLDLESINIMVQKEVAERLTTSKLTKERSSITYIIEYYTFSEISFYVDRHSFMPAPKVDSAVMKMYPKTKEQIEKIWEFKNINEIDLEKYEKTLFDIIKTGFLQKRKTFINSVSSTGKYLKESFREILEKLNLNQNIRAENISLKEYVSICKMYLQLYV